jgi:hypothetical protein
MHKIDKSMQIYDFSGIPSYYSEDLTSWLTKKGLKEAWDKWAFGNTVGLLNDRVVVYKHDVEAFLSGQRNYD